MDSSKNSFFASNSVKVIPRSTSYSAQFPMQKKPEPDLNPQAFTYREVFNSKMYQTKGKIGSICSHGQKFFNIKISKKDRIISGMGDEEGQYLRTFRKAFETYPLTKQKAEVFQTLLHHFNLLEKETKHLSQKNPLKFTLLNINKYLEEFLLFLHEDIVNLRNKLKELELNINEKRRLSQTKEVENESPIRQSRIKTHKDHSKFNELKKEASRFEFQNNKLKLLVEKLQKDLVEKDKELLEKQVECEKYQRKSLEIEKQQEGYDFKMRKLKQELEVAHIVKNQNLADKMSYIFKNS